MIAAALTYPTAAEVQQADRAQLLDWCQTLPDPGESAWGDAGFLATKQSDLAILELIFERMRETRPPLLNWALPDGSHDPVREPPSTTLEMNV